MITTRFSPSPTGSLHIGGARTALFNWLFARSQGGEFLLRIDDTDVARNQEEALKPILDGLRWLGLDWDREPVHQSARSDRYAEILAALELDGKIYRDYSTPEEREQARQNAENNKQPFRWRGRPSSAHQMSLYDKENRPWAYRFNVTIGQDLVLNDLLKGTITIRTDQIGDFVVARSDRSPLYSFATVVDEHDMDITHVLRADEHLTNTFSQLMIYNALKWTIPQFGHMPFVAEPGSKQKLSKRKITEYEAKGIFILIEQFQKAGYLPEAMVNYLARLGWSLDDHTEIFSRDDLLKSFSLDRIVHAPASHDQDKLHHIQGEWMKTKSMDDKVEIAYETLKETEAVYKAKDRDPRPLIRQVLEVLGDRFKIGQDIIRLGWYFFTDRIVYDKEAFEKRVMLKGVSTMLSTMRDMFQEHGGDPDAEGYEKLINYYIEYNNWKKSEINHALRVAVTGQMIGGSLYHTMAVLGKEKVMKRIDDALSHRRKLKNNS